MCGKRGVDGEEEHGKKKREGLKKKQPGRQKAQGVFIESVKLCQTPLEIKKKRVLEMFCYICYWGDH